MGTNDIQGMGTGMYSAKKGTMPNTNHSIRLNTILEQ